MKPKIQKTQDAFFLFEAIIVISIFFSVVIAIFQVINFSIVSFKKNMQHFNSVCQVSDFYNENQNTVKHTGETIYFDGVAFYKFSVTTDIGTKYVFIKK